MNKLIASACAIILCFLVACEEKKDDTQTNKYNAFFVYPVGKDKRTYVGTVKGLSSCKYIVSDYYSKRRKFIKGDWDYVCCLRAEGNECLEEHRYDQ